MGLSWVEVSYSKMESNADVTSPRFCRFKICCQRFHLPCRALVKHILFPLLSLPENICKIEAGQGRLVTVFPSLIVTYSKNFSFFSTAAKLKSLWRDFPVKNQFIVIAAWPKRILPSCVLTQLSSLLSIDSAKGYC